MKHRNVALIVLGSWTLLMAALAVGILGLTDDQIASIDWQFVGRVAFWAVIWMWGASSIAVVTVVARLGRQQVAS